MRTLGIVLAAVVLAVLWIAAILVAGPLMFALVRALPGWCSHAVAAGWFCALFPRELDATNYAQLSATLLSAIFAALAAIAASWLTAFYLLKQQRERDLMRRRQAAAAIALEIGTFLKTLDRLLPSAHLEKRVSADRKRSGVCVQINAYDFWASLPPRVIYDQVITEIALLDGVSLPVALFYRQVGRALADFERGWLGAPAFGHLFVKAADAMLALAPYSKITEQTIVDVNRAIWILLHPDFQRHTWNAANPMAVYMWKDEEHRCIRAWTDLAEKKRNKKFAGLVTSAYPPPSNGLQLTAGSGRQEGRRIRDAAASPLGLRKLGAH